MVKSRVVMENRGARLNLPLGQLCMATVAASVILVGLFWIWVDLSEILMTSVVGRS